MSFILVKRDVCCAHISDTIVHSRMLFFPFKSHILTFICPDKKLPQLLQVDSFARLF